MSSDERSGESSIVDLIGIFVWVGGIPQLVGLGTLVVVQDLSKKVCNGVRNGKQRIIEVLTVSGDNEMVVECQANIPIEVVFVVKASAST